MKSRIVIEEPMWMLGSPEAIRKEVERRVIAAAFHEFSRKAQRDGLVTIERFKADGSPAAANEHGAKIARYVATLEVDFTLNKGDTL